MLLLVSLFSLVIADSIILQNDCKRTSEQCFITLEVIKGEPKKDCSVFSTVERGCTVGMETAPSIAPPDEGIQVTQTDSGTVISWTGQKIKGNGTETNSLTAASIWQRIKRQTRGQVVNCTCIPVGRQKRSAGEPSSFSSSLPDLDSKKKKSCVGGFRPTSKTMDPSANSALTVKKTTNIDKCAASCTAENDCDSFAAFADSNSARCVHLKKNQAIKSDGPFVIFERC